MRKSFVGVSVAYINRSSPNTNLIPYFIERYLLTDEGLAAMNQAKSIRFELAHFLCDHEYYDEALPLLQDDVVVAAQILAQQGRKTADYLGIRGEAEAWLGLVRRADNQAGWKEAIRSGLIYIQKAAEIDTKKIDYLKYKSYLRKYLAKELNNDKRTDDSRTERELALKAYQQVIKVAPHDQEARDAIRELGVGGENLILEDRFGQRFFAVEI